MSRAGRRKPDPIELTIDDLSHDGRGVGHLEGKAVFVPDALPGERVRAQPYSRRSKFDQANLLEVLAPSDQRVEPRCPHFGDCAGCALQHLNGADQIAFKSRVLEENLERIGGVQAQQVIEPLREDAWGYRRKARLSVKWVPGKGRALVGFRERNPRFVANLTRCEILHPAIGERIDALSELVGSLSVSTRIPQIEIAAGDEGVVLIIRHLEPLTDADLDQLKRFSDDTGLGIYLQPKGPDTVHPLSGNPSPLSYRLPAHDLRFHFDPLDFIQVNASMNRRMVDQALSWLSLEPDHRVLDLFCGLGNFSLPMARHCAAVVGVEGELSLVEKARFNAEQNRINNAHFYVADLRESQSAPWHQDAYDRVLLDPPRSGAQECLGWLAEIKPQRIVYVSCHPGSLARDAGILVKDYGYHLTAAGVMDMFPHTAHVESMAVFDR